VARSFGGRARFVVENYGDSELARRNGVTRYPAIFVGDVLVATPKDFGFYGKGEGEGAGRYAPLRSAASHDRFRADLTRMVELILAGRRQEAAAGGVTAGGGEIAALPALVLTDLAGRPITRADLAGRVVLVEFWATWCPPCRGTLAWLGEMKKRHGDRVVVLAPALESDEADVQEMAAGLSRPCTSGAATASVT
jgi:thiol-disulfide isomerase/thioredoxin